MTRSDPGSSHEDGVEWMELSEGFGLEVNGATVSISGDLDAYTATKLEETLNRVLEAGATDFIIDMSAVDFVDSSGLRTLIHAGRMGGTERQVIIRSPSPATVRLFEITGMMEHFVIEDSQGDAT